MRLRGRAPSLRARAALARATGQFWGQVRGALAFGVAPPRRKSAPRAVRPGDMALTPPA